MVRKDSNLVDAIKNYLPSSIKDGGGLSKHESDIEQMFYLEKLEHLLVMEKDAKSFKVYDAATGKYK
jgi:hypothetical protein